MKSQRNVKLSGLMLIMALVLMPLFSWTAPAVAGTIPVVTTDSASSIGNSSAVLNGEYGAASNGTTEYGFYYGTTSTPTTQVKVGSSMDTAQSFNYTLSLNPDTTYYFKAYATNGNGPSYGSILSFTAYSTDNPLATFTLDSVNYQVDGVNQITEVAPFIKNGRILLPIVDVANGLGVKDANVVWDGTNQTITLTKGSRVVQLTMDNNTILVNNMSTSTDVAPEIANGRRVLPLAVVARDLGATVSWDDATNTVTIQN